MCDMLFAEPAEVVTIRQKKSNAFFCKISRHWLIILFVLIVFLLVFLNFLGPYHSVYKDLSSSRAKNFRDGAQFQNLITERPTDRSEETNRDCEIIHVGFVCSGFKSNLQLHTVLKSIYFYRINPLHFHIFANKFSEKTLKYLITTWDIPQVNVTFYDINDFILDVRWVPNSHYSGIFGLLKLVFPKVISLNVTNKVIILDTDLVFVSDIGELWQMFDKFKASQAVGVIENESNYYLVQSGAKNKAWPALGRGFNSGVILYHLEKLKKLGWHKLWTSTTKRVASIYGTTRLGDQDIINAVLLQNPTIFYQVPCYWNTQLSDHTLSGTCYEKHRIKVVHWNSPKKINVINKDADYFRNLYTTFSEMNGNLLRRQLRYCDNNRIIPDDSLENVCSQFHKAVTNKWRTLLYFRDYRYYNLDYDITFVAQLSYDRLQLVEELVKYWAGPISLTFYVTDPEFDQCNEFIDNSELLKDRTNIAYHAVFKDGEYYPINILRNVGLKNVNTPYVFLADIDFLPFRGLYSLLKNTVATIKSMKNKALIIPAFETQRYRSRLPKSKIQLLEMWEKKLVFPFRSDLWQAGHAPTNYTKWKTAISMYKVKWEPDFEPYIVVSHNVTEYDRRFMGFGWNKVSHIMELEAQGYEWIVLHNAFIIHKAHAPSYDIAKFRSSPTYRMCLQILKEEFIQDLNRKYGRYFENKNSSFAIDIK